MHIIYCGIMFTTIRVSKKTKELLDRLVIELERELGRRLSYDEALRMLIERSLRAKRPELLLQFMSKRFSDKTVKDLQEIVRIERARENEIAQRRYCI